MEKHKRQRIYDWVRKNQSNEGEEYGPFVANYRDYDRIRVRLNRSYKYAHYAHKPISSDKIKMIIRIGPKIPYDMMKNANEDYV